LDEFNLNERYSRFREGGESYVTVTNG